MKPLRFHIFFLLLPFVSLAQQNLTLYGMKDLSQAFYVNPGFYQKNRVYVSLPIGIQTIALSHNGFTLGHLLETTNNNSYIQPERAISKMGKLNLIAFEQSSELFGFGMKIKKKNYLSFSASLKSNAIFSYPRSFFQLLNEGNGSSSLMDQRLSMDGLGFYGNIYSEYALGYNRSLSDKLCVGGRLKLFSGIANIATTKSDLGITTNSQSFDLTLDGQIAVNSSNSLYFTESSKSNEFNKIFPSAAFDFKNIGFGIDAGASYKLNKKFEFSASLVDLGFIRWKSNTKNYVSSRVNYTFTGVDLDSVLLDNIGFDKYLDTLESVFGYSSNSQAYSTSLFTRLYLGGVYNLNKTFSSSFTLHNQVMANRIRTGAAIGMNMHIRNWLNFSVNYAAYGRSFKNIGMGLSLKGGPIQFFILTDNILCYLNPTNAKNLHLSFGLNVSIGPLKDKDEDGVKDRKDNCPELPGKPEFKGCPDTDNDGITDAKDAGPDHSGIQAFKGCPDRDNDSIIDKNDSCPDLKGLVSFKGCPDSDGDGVMDKEDNCPETSGLIVNQGCPDTDKDGILDILDGCPDQIGPKENNGCPWPDTDKDGLIDKDDACPNLAGSILNKGCPDEDSDNDGLSDKDDECPGTAGPISNKGCPIIEAAVQEIIQTAFDNLEFETGKDIIKQVSLPSLNALAEVFTKKPEWNLQISGHTDNVGDDQKNLILSQKRAEAVKNHLTSRGLDAKRFYVLYFGETMPIESNDTPEGRQKNRRVEMKIIFK
jgi:outer membrane protein OmpA-like peptidoglycan-associated protein